MDLLRTIDSLVDKQAKDGGFSGVVLLHGQEGEIYVRAVGLAHRGHDVANAPDTHFGIASVTKMITAVATLQLIETGRIGFDTRAVEYLGLSDAQISPDVTVYHLLTHTSGMATYFDDTGDESANYEKIWQETANYSIRNLSDFLPLFAHSPPISQPGGGFRYCDAGYIVLGLVIERASDLSYFEYVKENVFEAAGMHGSGFLALDGIDENVAEGYIPIKDSDDTAIGWKKNIYAIPAFSASDGGAFCTAGDMARFLKALREGALLSESMTREVLTPRVDDQVTEDGTWKYGYGMWFLVDKQGSMVRYGHSGEDPGVSCRVYHYPGQGIDMIILGNQSYCAGTLSPAIHDAIIRGQS